MASIDFSFITDDCRYDNGELRQALEDLCDLADEEITVLDPNAGICGEWGADSTIDSVSFNPVTDELSIAAVPEWTALLVSESNSATYSPATDISGVALYPGPTMPINIVNPSSCRALKFFGVLTCINVITYTDGNHIICEIRDITGGAPGVVTGDVQRLMGGYGAGVTDYYEESFTTPITASIVAGGSLSVTYQNYIQTIATAGTTTSLWHQTFLSLSGIGVLE